MSSLFALVQETGLATAAELELGDCAARCFGGNAIEHLASVGLLSDVEVCAAISARFRVPAVNPQRLDLPDGEAIEHIGHDTLAEHRALPLGDEDGHLIVAMCDPGDELACEELTFFAGRPIVRRAAGPLAMARAQARWGIGRGIPRLGVDEVGYALLAFALRRAQNAALLWVGPGGVRVGLSTLPAAARTAVAPPPLTPSEAPLLTRLLERPRAARAPRLGGSEHRFFSHVLGGPVDDLVAVSVGAGGERVQALLCAAQHHLPWQDDDFRAAAAYCTHGLPYVFAPAGNHAAA